MSKRKVALLFLIVLVAASVSVRLLNGQFEQLAPPHVGEADLQLVAVVAYGGVDEDAPVGS